VVQKLVKSGLKFLPTRRKICVLLHCQALHAANGTQPNFAKSEEIHGTDASRIRWCRIVNENETIEIRSLVTRGCQKHFKLAMALRRAALSGNTSLIATFSSYLKKAHRCKLNAVNFWSD